MTRLLLALALALPALSATWTFPAGPPQLTKGGGIAFPMDDAAYAKFAEQSKASGRTIIVTARPAHLSPDAKIGYNFVVGGKNRGWILDGDDEHGWVLYLDWKGDGDLSNAQPQKLEKIDGIYRLQVDVPDGGLHWPCRFEIGSFQVQGKDTLGVRIGDTTVRSGVIELEGQRYPFRLSGSHGKYDSEYDHLSVDRFAGAPTDGYKATDRYLNLAGKSYEFRVDPLGASLTLTALAEARPDRPSLRVDSTAPDFTTADIDGQPRKLADYRGRLLLVEFWSTLCGPCREEAPRMVELYRSFPREKVEFLGVTSDPSADKLRGYLHELHLSWPQVREPFEGPIHQLYRVAGEPTYFLIGKDGIIVDTWIGSGETTARLNKALK